MDSFSEAPLQGRYSYPAGRDSLGYGTSYNPEEELQGRLGGFSEASLGGRLGGNSEAPLQGRLGGFIEAPLQGRYSHLAGRGGLGYGTSYNPGEELTDRWVRGNPTHIFERIV